MADSPYVFEGTPENFQTLVIDKSNEIPILVDFWAAWCNPCQMLLPIVTRLAEEYQGKFHLVKVNSDEQQALAAQFGVRSLPTLKIFWQGEVVEEIMGAQPEPVLRQMLDQYVQVEVDPRILQAQELLEQGQMAEAHLLMQQAHEGEPENLQITTDLIRLTVMMGDHAKANEMIAELPRETRESAEINELSAQIQFAGIIQDSPDADTLQQNIDQDATDLDSRYKLAAWRVMEGDFDTALQQLLEIMKRDRGWQDDQARKSILAIFDMIPGHTDLISKYRRQMFNLLH